MTDERRLCGAKTRSGQACKASPIKGKRRCKMHGGMSTGPRKGTRNALKHGIYSDVLSPEDKKTYDRIELGSIDDEIRIARIQLRRALQEQERQRSFADAGIDELRRTMEVQEIKSTSIAGQTQQLEIKRTRKDYSKRIGQLLRLIAELEARKLELGQANPGSADEIAAKIKRALDEIDAMNTPAPEQPK
jgi:hypothetical protein